MIKIVEHDELFQKMRGLLSDSNALGRYNLNSNIHNKEKLKSLENKEPPLGLDEETKKKISEVFNSSYHKKERLKLNGCNECLFHDRAIQNDNNCRIMHIISKYGLCKPNKPCEIKTKKTYCHHCKKIINKGNKYKIFNGQRNKELGIGSTRTIICGECYNKISKYKDYFMYIVMRTKMFNLTPKETDIVIDMSIKSINGHPMYGHTTVTNVSNEWIKYFVNKKHEDKK